MSKRNGSRGESGKEASALRSIHICVCVLVNILNHDNNTMTEGGVANGVPNVLHDRVGGGTEGDQDRVGPRRTEAKAINLRVPIRAPRRRGIGWYRDFGSNQKESPHDAKCLAMVREICRVYLCHCGHSYLT
jgi:hypothetical protein